MNGGEERELERPPESVGEGGPKPEAVPNLEAPKFGLPFSRIVDIERLPEGERWLIDGFLTGGSLTVLAASPKAGKTWVALALAVGVASGTPALGRFHVPAPGRVLVFPAEDDVRSVRERIEGLCIAEGLELGDLPLDIITADTLKLDDEGDKAKLEQLLEHCRPKLLVLDPLVRLHSGAESYVGHIAELFGYLRGLQRKFEMAVLVTHHSAKSRAGSGVGQSMRGSGDIHAAYDHGAMLSREPDGAVLLQLEHRIAAAPEPLAFRLVSTKDGGTKFEFVELFEDDGGSETPRSVRKEQVRKPRPMVKADAGLSLAARVLDLLNNAPDPLSQVKIRTALGVRNQVLTETLRELAEIGSVENLGRMKGWHRPGAVKRESR